MTSYRNTANLPAQFPVFPLTGVVLLPFGHLPLNIFEPRYLNMVDDALGNGRLIAMIQPRAVLSDLVPDDAALYDVGTLGRIIQFSDIGDGRYHITLEGLARFRVGRELGIDPTRGYRVVAGDFRAFQADLSPTEHPDGFGRVRVLELMRDYFSGKEIDADWDAVSDASYEALITSLAMSCPFEPGEKQALLECASHEDRARMLISLFEMSVESARNPGGLKH